jgi:hypothetical protein
MKLLAMEQQFKKYIGVLSNSASKTALFNSAVWRNGQLRLLENHQSEDNQTCHLDSSYTPGKCLTPSLSYNRQLRPKQK